MLIAQAQKGLHPNETTAELLNKRIFYSNLEMHLGDALSSIH